MGWAEDYTAGPIKLIGATHVRRKEPFVPALVLAVVSIVAAVLGFLVL